MMLLKKRFNLIAILFALTVAVGFSSCDDDDEPYSGYNNLGTWNLYSINGNYVIDTESYDLSFYADGSGVREMFATGSQWGFVWDIFDVRDGEMLRMVFPDGATYEYIITLGWDESGNYMLLYDLNTGNELLFYAY